MTGNRGLSLITLFKKCFTEGSLPKWDYPVTQNTFKEIKFILDAP
jgi:hypothetical protein